MLQGTLSHDITRSRNDRYGGGGHYQVNDRVGVSGEMTDGNGDSGTGGKLGTDYRVTDRTSLYLHYLVDTDSSCNDVGTYLSHPIHLPIRTRRIGVSSAVSISPSATRVRSARQTRITPRLWPVMPIGRCRMTG